MFSFPNKRKLWVGAVGTGMLLVAGTEVSNGSARLAHYSNCGSSSRFPS
jgi:hypothetical protein